MSKKKYVAPEMELWSLEQSDIITQSIGSVSGSFGGEEDDFGTNANTLNEWN